MTAPHILALTGDMMPAHLSPSRPGRPCGYWKKTLSDISGMMLKEFRIPDKFKLLSKESQLQYKEQFEGATRVIMLSIGELLDEKYRRAFSGS